jgi:hypothetical protein
VDEKKADGRNAHGHVDGVPESFEEIAAHEAEIGFKGSRAQGFKGKKPLFRPLSRIDHPVDFVLNQKRRVQEAGSRKKNASIAGSFHSNPGPLEPLAPSNHFFGFAVFMIR